jgi:hypothetical protein
MDEPVKIELSPLVSRRSAPITDEAQEASPGATSAARQFWQDKAAGGSPGSVGSSGAVGPLVGRCDEMRDVARAAVATRAAWKQQEQEQQQEEEAAAVQRQQRATALATAVATRSPTGATSPGVGTDIARATAATTTTITAATNANPTCLTAAPEPEQASPQMAVPVRDVVVEEDAKPRSRQPSLPARDVSSTSSSSIIGGGSRLRRPFLAGHCEAAVEAEVGAAEVAAQGKEEEQQVSAELDSTQLTEAEIMTETVARSMEARAAPLPQGWFAAVSRSSGAVYFVNSLTGASTYHRPQAPATTDDDLGHGNQPAAPAAALPSWAMASFTSAEEAEHSGEHSDTEQQPPLDEMAAEEIDDGGGQSGAAGWTQRTRDQALLHELSIASRTLHQCTMGTDDDEEQQAVVAGQSTPNTTSPITQQQQQQLLVLHTSADRVRENSASSLEQLSPTPPPLLPWQQQQQQASKQRPSPAESAVATGAALSSPWYASLYRTPMMAQQRARLRADTAEQSTEPNRAPPRFSDEFSAASTALHSGDSATGDSPTDFSALADSFRRLVAADCAQEGEAAVVSDEVLGGGTEESGRLDTSEVAQEEALGDRKHEQQRAEPADGEIRPGEEEGEGEQDQQELEPEPEPQPRNEEGDSVGVRALHVGVGDRCEITLQGRLASAEVMFLGQAPLLGPGAQ